MSFIRSKGLRIATVAGAFFAVASIGSVAYSAPAGCEDDLNDAVVTVAGGVATVSGLSPECWEDGQVFVYDGGEGTTGASGAGGDAGAVAQDSGLTTYPTPSRASRVEMYHAGTIDRVCASDSLSPASELGCGYTYGGQIGSGTVDVDGDVITVEVPDGSGTVTIMAVLDDEGTIIQRTVAV